MISPRALLVTAVGAGCLIASGVGGYFAVKSNIGSATETPLAAAQPTVEEGTGGIVVSGDAGMAPVPSRDAGSAPPVERQNARPAPRAAQTRSEAQQAAAPVAAPEIPPAAVAATPTPVEGAASAVEAANTPVDPAPPIPPAPTTRELTVPGSSVIGIRLERAVSSESARVEDRVYARVTRDVRVDDVIAIPAGAKLEGNVTLVERGGKFKDRSRIGIQFTTLVVDDARIRIQTETILREGETPTKDAAAKIGASAVIGTILGAVIGGGKGAAIGSAAGAAGGGAAVAAGGRNDVTLAEGASLTVKLTEPVDLKVARDQ